MIVQISPPITLDYLSLDKGNMCDMYENANVLSLVSQYARLKAMAMGKRKDGDDVGAESIERRMERLYETLPAWVRC